MLTNGNKDKPSFLNYVVYKRFGLMAFLLIILCATVFYLGAAYACNQGQGRLMGLECIEMIDVGACYDIEKDRYLVPIDENGTPLTEGLNLTI